VAYVSVDVAVPTRARPVSASDAKGELSAVAWVPGRQLDYEDWLRLGSRLGVAGRGSGWWLGDWLRYGTASYGSKYTAAVRVTGYDRQTLMNMVYVATRFPISRRRESLSWSHHAEVAGLDSPDQDRWLERAAVERLTVRELRLELLSSRRRLATNDEEKAPERADPLGPVERGTSDVDAPRERDPGEPAPAASGGDNILTCPHCGRTFSEHDRPGATQ
jgi:hypothetical protein